jgi:aryl-alcohol dehydrogenase-like predicted oxidoreductase
MVGAPDEHEAIAAIRRSLDLGVTLFDTSNNYGAGNSERVLGRGLGRDRERVLVVTKFGWRFDEKRRVHYDGEPMPLDERSIRAALASSLRRHGTDYVDIYLLHVAALELDRAHEVAETLERLVSDGVIRTYGWSTDDTERAQAFAKHPNCSVVEHRLSVVHHADAMLEVCEEHDLASLARSPLASGLLSGKYTAASRFPESDIRHSEDLADRLAAVEHARAELTRSGRSLVEGALRWILDRSRRTIPIPGFKTVAQVEENAAAGLRR